MGYLSRFDPELPVVMDLETISWSDTDKAINPWKGHRISGVVLAQTTGDGEDISEYFPIRHRTDGAGCLPLEPFLAEFREFAAQVKVVCNAWLRFDLHFAEADGVSFREARMEHLEVLGRIVHNDLMAYSLDGMALMWCPDLRKDERVKQWCKDNDTEDYGAVPIPLMREYAIRDGLVALRLRRELLARLPERSLPVWNEECDFADFLLATEAYGVDINVEWLQFHQLRLLQEMIGKQATVNALLSACTEGKITALNCRSNKQMNQCMAALGVAPVAWNEKEDEQGNVISKTPCWDGKAMEAILLDMEEDTPLYKLLDAIGDYKDAAIAEGTFCQGWMDLAVKGVLHCTFKAGGTGTGRISSSKPNMQNPPKWVMEAIVIPDGRVGVRFDYSQIEYRIAAHYFNDPELTAAYAANPAIDFHQTLADRILFDRDPTKTINFMCLYGGGKKKLRKALAKEIRKMKPERFAEMQKRYGQTPEQIAASVHDEYHVRLPGLKRMNREIEAVIESRGWVKNFFGRMYQFELDRSYVALNYICQGTAADLFKARVNALWRRCRDYDIVPVTNIHDACYFHMAPESVAWFWQQCKEVLGDVPGLRIPILAEGECYTRHWGLGKKVVTAEGKKTYLRYTNGEIFKLGHTQQEIPAALDAWLAGARRST